VALVLRTQIYMLSEMLLRLRAMVLAFSPDRFARTATITTLDYRLNLIFIVQLGNGNRPEGSARLNNNFQLTEFSIPKYKPAKGVGSEQAGFLSVGFPLSPQVFVKPTSRTRIMARREKMRNFFLVILCAFIFALPLAASGQEQSGEPTKFDGHRWETLTLLVKRAIVWGYISGYRDGRSSGLIEGADMAESEFKKNVRERCAKPETKEECDYYIEKARFAAAYVNIKAVQGLSLRETPFYQKEIDAFYNTFPLCKRLDLHVILSGLMQVWIGGPLGIKSYKEIGEECLESPK
jgi:hypothetical protein